MTRDSFPLPPKDALAAPDGSIEQPRRRGRTALIGAAAFFLAAGTLLVAQPFSNEQDGAAQESDEAPVAPIEGDAEWAPHANVIGNTWEIGGVATGDQAAEDLPPEEWPNGVILTAEAEDLAAAERVAVVYDNGSPDSPSPEPGILGLDELQPNPDDATQVIAAMHQGSSDTAYALARVQDDESGQPQVTLVDTGVSKTPVEEIAAQGIIFR